MSEKRFLVHINLGGKPSKDRIREAATQIKAIVADLSPSHQLAYTSGDGGTFGFFILSALKAIQLTVRINNPGTEDSRRPSPLRTEDSLMVVEIGTDGASIGKTRVASWFKFHRPDTSPAAESEAAVDEPQAQGQLASQLAALKDKIGK